MRDQQDVTIGRIVHYRLELGPHKGELRPAVVTRVWGPEMVNLLVLTDGGNDGVPCPYWATSVHTGGGEREWRWPHADEPQTGADPSPLASMAEVAGTHPAAATPVEATAGT